MAPHLTDRNQSGWELAADTVPPTASAPSRPVQVVTDGASRPPHAGSFCLWASYSPRSGFITLFPCHGHIRKPGDVYGPLAELRF